MKIIVEGLDIKDAIATVGRIATTRNVNPILEGIKLTAKDGVLTLSATDLEIYVQKKIRADVKQEGEIIVPGRLFSDYLRKLDASQVSIASDGESVVITHGDNVCKFQCLPVEEFPDIIQLDAKPHFSIKSEDFRDLIAKTTICASTDDSRPVLRGVLCEIAKDTLTAVALDGFRLARIEKTISSHLGETKVIIPARSLDEVKKLCGEENGEVNIIIQNKFFQVNVAGTTFASRLIEGEFINYRQIIPSSFVSDVVVERSAFENAVERAGLLVRSDKVNLVTLKIADKFVTVTSNNEIGKINERVPSNLSGKDLSISFNAKYLFDALRNIQAGFIKLSLTGDHSPAIITSAKDGDFLFLILPVRMS
ncbi:MAG: DNA polymerase III subunit beta [Firmicutes bacterium]|nr:DNA polymerase III subunit beta [Bacillota bacterium]